MQSLVTNIGLPLHSHAHHHLQVIEALYELDLANTTIISFWGDHGWQLGEHAEWCKHTNFEVATHAPMMMSIPGSTDEGVVVEALTEFVDLFPTLAEAAGLPTVPRCPQDSSKVCNPADAMTDNVHYSL